MSKSPPNARNPVFYRRQQFCYLFKITAGHPLWDNIMDHLDIPAYEANREYENIKKSILDIASQFEEISVALKATPPHFSEDFLAKLPNAATIDELIQ